MKVFQQSFPVSTSGKKTYEITELVQRIVDQSGVRTGIASVFLRHTSASLVLYENADPTARNDLHAWMERLVPENDPLLRHVSEGPDDSTSHLRMAITRSSENIPVRFGKLQLGTWQGIFVFEHRQYKQQRMVDVTVIGTTGIPE